MPTQKFFLSVLGVMLILTAVSCGEESWEPGENSSQNQEAPYLRADNTSVTVPAQEMKAAPTDKAVLISSNRAWTASLEPAAEWVRVSCMAGQNEDHSNKKTLLVFSFDKYENEEADRRTTLKLQGEDGLSLELPVIQQKAIPIPLVLKSSDESVTALAEMPGGTSVVKNLKITTNISWTAAFEPSVDWVSVSPATHEHEDREENEDVDIVLTFQPNESITDGRSTTLVLTAADNKGRLEIPVVQNRKEATVQWVSEATDYVGTTPGSVTLNFVATSSWTASLENEVDGISLSATSGDPTVTSLDVNFTEFYGPGAVRSATVVLSLSNGVTAKLQVRQIGTELYLDFINGNQPFTTDIPYDTQVAGQETEYTLSCNGSTYKFSFYSAAGYKFVTGTEGKTCGFMTSKNDWVKLPGVEGMKLKTAEVYTSNMGSTGVKGYGLRETADGSNLKSLWVAANSEWCTLVLSNPVAGQSYYLVSLNNTAYFSKIHLIYEY